MADGFNPMQGRSPRRGIGRGAIVALVIIAFLLGAIIGDSGLINRYLGRPLAYVGIHTGGQWGKLQQVYSLVLDKHVNPSLDQTLMREDAIKGMLMDVDGGYTRYVTAEEYKDESEQNITGEYAGIGVSVRLVKELVTVESVFPGGPAAKGGVKPQDAIIAVDGETLSGTELADVTKKIKGPVGSKVKVTVFRKSTNETLDLELTRDTIQTPVVTYTLRNGIAHIVLTQYNEQSTPQIRTALKQAIDDKAKAVLLDLRYNPGGLLTVCEEIVNFFLPPNQVIVTTHSRTGTVQEARTQAAPLWKGPLAILINEGSASASEITSGAIKDNQRGVLLGAKSFGKGTVQLGYPLGDGSVVWVTTQTYRTPSGADINKKGIEPDVKIEQPELPESAYEQEVVPDPQLDAALKWVNDNLATLPTLP
jgi:carboxyl-terminal processing protease